MELSWTILSDINLLDDVKSIINKGLNERAQQLLDLAISEARARNHEYIGTEHVLLACMSSQMESEIPFHVLTEAEIGRQLLACRVSGMVHNGPEQFKVEHFALTPHLQQALCFARNEAGKGAPISPGHIFIGLLEAEESIANSVIENIGAASHELISAARMRLIHQSQE